MTKEAHALLKEHITAFRSGDRQQYNIARRNLNRGVEDAKAAHRDYKSNPDPLIYSNNNLVKELNIF